MIINGLKKCDDCGCTYFNPNTDKIIHLNDMDTCKDCWNLPPNLERLSKLYHEIFHSDKLSKTEK